MPGTLSPQKIRVLFLWHMHQPYYKDLSSGIYRLPWARLHGLKDYYGMVAMLEEFPRIHQTFNLVPSLLLQLEEYASGNAREPIQEAAFKPTEQLTTEDRLFILQYFFQANVVHLISRYPRYRELYDRMQANDFNAERSLPYFRDHDFTDLQVLSQLAWFDEIFLERDAELRALVSKQQGYRYEDQQILQRKESPAIGKALEAYRLAAQRGQIEISTSPFYHPILPLLCDTQVAREANAGVHLPARRFRHPEDARLQLERAIALHRRLFGLSPRGLWPSEGSVSEEVLEICASLGFGWVATDQQVLSNSIGLPFYRVPSGVLVNADRLYTAYGFSASSGEVRMLFRDHELSDLIGFVYSGMQPEEAARDLVGRIKQSALPLLTQGTSPLVPIVLDGENCWEYYPQNGRPFLRTLYRLLSEDPEIECLTVSEALDRQGPAVPLPRLATGSWINANFDIWIGAEEDNQAWDRLSEARDFFAEREKAAPPEQRELALEELLVAEGSDWCWWYGPEHSSANDADFDSLYRSHLANVYHALKERPPDYLGQPIAVLRQRVNLMPPTGLIAPMIDGTITNYFEWIGAGFYSPQQSGGAMHGRAPMMRELYYGRNAGNFFLRIDWNDVPPEEIAKTRLRLSFRPAGLHAITARFSPGKTERALSCELRRDEETGSLPDTLGQAALGKIFEMRVSLEAIGAGSSDPFDFQVTIWENEYPRETFPLEGWLSAPVQVSDSW
jgi:alpha-amylase/alpha-mannosidase (GH57 family)